MPVKRTLSLVPLRSSVVLIGKVTFSYTDAVAYNGLGTSVKLGIYTVSSSRITPTCTLVEVLVEATSDNDTLAVVY